MSTIDPPDRARTPARRRPPKKSLARRGGRLLAIVSFYGFVATFLVVSISQIASQLFWPEQRGPQPTSCTDGIQELADAVVRARGASAGIHTEAQALRRFRRALAPEWDGQATIASVCKGQKSNERALDAIVRLRYAEEHAVRRGAGDLAPLRAKVRSILAPLRKTHPAATDPAASHTVARPAVAP